MKKSGRATGFVGLLAMLACAAVLICGCGAGEKAEPARTVQEEVPVEEALSVVVFIPGVVAGSPPYEALVKGAEQVAADHGNVTVKVFEAGFNQAEWEEKITSLAATEMYDVILTSNPSLPEVCNEVGKKFPKQKFIIFDAAYEGNPQIVTYLYNQYEQSYYLGYLAGLITTSGMENANEDLKIGFIAAQEYPLLTKMIKPGLIDGAREVNPEITMDFRIIGNWYDANKGAELANSMMDAGVDVFAVIAGGAGQGLIQAAKERGAYIVYHNTDEYAKAPGVIVGCGKMEQEKLTVKVLEDELRGEVEYGTSTVVDTAKGYLDFLDDAPGYTDYIPAELQEEFNVFMSRIRDGKVAMATPAL